MSKPKPIGKKTPPSEEEIEKYLKNNYFSLCHILKNISEISPRKEKDVYDFYLFCGETEFVHNYGCPVLECTLRIQRVEPHCYVRLYIGTIDDSEVEYIGPLEPYEKAVKRQQKALEVVKSWRGLLPKTMQEIEKVKLSKSEY